MNDLLITVAIIKNKPDTLPKYSHGQLLSCVILRTELYSLFTFRLICCFCVCVCPVKCPEIVVADRSLMTSQEFPAASASGSFVFLHFQGVICGVALSG